MIGPKDRTAAYAPDIERALLYTAAGMAHLAEPDSAFTCGDCVHWTKAPRMKLKGYCREYTRLMHGRRGAPIGASFRTMCEPIGPQSVRLQGTQRFSAKSAAAWLRRGHGVGRWNVVKGAVTSRTL